MASALLASVSSSPLTLSLVVDAGFSAAVGAAVAVGAGAGEGAGEGASLTETEMRHAGGIQSASNPGGVCTGRSGDHDDAQNVCSCA
jgi:hypothetical protein